MLSPIHLAAIARRRRLIVNFDVTFAINVQHRRLRRLLSDPSAEDLPETQRLSPVQVATIGHPDGELVNIPAAQGVEQTVQIRLNNALLEQPTVDDGWLVWPVAGMILAAGANLVGISAPGRALDAPQLVVEKLEIAVVCEAVD